jgi:hypothetical protein
MLKGIIVTLCLLIGAHLHAEEIHDLPSVSASVDDPGVLMNPNKEELVSSCVREYIKKQSKSYTKIVQGNLYDLIHNFDRVTSRIYGNPGKTDNIPYSEKIKTLAQIQCKVYFNMGMLK